MLTHESLPDLAAQCHAQHQQVARSIEALKSLGFDWTQFYLVRHALVEQAQSGLRASIASLNSLEQLLQKELEAAHSKPRRAA